MAIGSKILEIIQESDLQDLINNKVRERKTIEYKEILPGGDYEDKKEFLADVSSFANASGGDLIYGIKSEAGEPVELSGVVIDNVDSEILRLDNILRDGIRPRILGMKIKEVGLTNSKYIIIIRIPKSWALPHVVKYQRHWRFYSRNSAGKYPLDVAEVRSLFILSETIADKIRNFRNERISRIVAGETPVKLVSNELVILHIIPISAFDPAKRVEFSLAQKEAGLLRPLNTAINSTTFNFDGLLVFDYSNDPGTAHSYLQLFRSGIVETANARILRNKKAQIVTLEKGMLTAIPRYLTILNTLGVDLPLIVMVSLVGVSGCNIAVKHPHDLYDGIHPIDRENLLIPEVLMESFDVNVDEKIKPIFDAIWNAFGFSETPNYDSVGKKYNLI